MVKIYSSALEVNAEFNVLRLYRLSIFNRGLFTYSIPHSFKCPQICSTSITRGRKRGLGKRFPTYSLPIIDIGKLVIIYVTQIYPVIYRHLWHICNIQISPFLPPLHLKIPGYATEEGSFAVGQCPIGIDSITQHYHITIRQTKFSLLFPDGPTYKKYQ